MSNVGVDYLRSGSRETSIVGDDATARGGNCDRVGAATGGVEGY